MREEHTAQSVVASTCGRRTGSIGGSRDFSGLLNTLDRMRDPARYGLQPWSLTPDEMISLLTRAEKMLDAVASRVPRRGKVLGCRRSSIIGYAHRRLRIYGRILPRPG